MKLGPNWPVIAIMTMAGANNSNTTQCLEFDCWAENCSATVWGGA